MIFLSTFRVSDYRSLLKLFLIYKSLTNIFAHIRNKAITLTIYSRGYRFSWNYFFPRNYRIVKISLF